ncbi:reverse transcriptase domain-containing protein [Anaerobacillus sp. MEB173]|uniref:reverse transcriptase domain-containing protein n=1 Tax=Anaerobacillus sp. MEB173 TaxID=3383345 RepID=UPI003F91B276
MLKEFDIENIEKIYSTKVQNGKLNSGLDRISRKKFNDEQNSYFKIISRKVQNQTYQFSPYKEVLINKGKDKTPRVISIPTIRDKITLKIIHDILSKNFKKCIKNPLAKQDLISNISTALKKNKYNYFMAIDIKNYYDHVNHDKLFKTLITKINDKAIIDLIFLAIKNCTFPENTPKKDRTYIKRHEGLPQGISISNPLANIYLSEFDKTMNLRRKFKYFRYVDDILILCKESDQQEIIEFIKNELVKFHLNLHEEQTEKIKKGYLPGEIKFLGYTFLDKGKVSISKKNVKRMELRLEQNFKDFSSSKDKKIKNNTELLKWNIDLAVAGIIKNKRTYGWLYYFKKNDCEEIMFHLDKVVEKLIKRYKLQNDLTLNGKYIGKRFVRVFHEMKNNHSQNKHILNVDTADINYKRHILQNIYKRNINKLNDSSIDYEFNRYIFKSIREIEYDLQQIYS